MIVYENAKVYGPYKNRESRLFVILIYDSGTRKTVSYPKFLVEKHLNRYLHTNETVDHIDRNKENNSIDNLQILDKAEHSKLDAIRIKDVVVSCVWCKKEFTIKGNKIRNRTKKAGPFCSRRCSGLYGRSVQKEKKNKLSISNIEKVYFRLDK